MPSTSPPVCTRDLLCLPSNPLPLPPLQLTLRVKALKRQVDESEGEVERLEGVRRKVLRDLEEQQELQEAMRAKVTALEAELKRKSQQTHRTALSSTTLSSEEEDSFYDNNITSILNESHLQTTNC